MNLRNGQITVGEVLANPQARALLYREFPQVMGNPLLMRARGMPLGQALTLARRFVPQQRIDQALAQLRAL